MPREDVVMTTQRRKVIEALRDHGPMIDPDGRAVDRLREITGHDSVMGLSKVLRQMENLGLIERDVVGRRTHRIALHDDARMFVPAAEATAGIADMTERLETLVELPEQSFTAGNGLQGDEGGDGINYDLLAEVLLKKALAATRVQERAVADAAARSELVRAHEEQSAQLDRLTGENARLHKTIADLEKMATDLQTELDMLNANLRKVMAQRDQARREGVTIRERLSDQERREMDALMQALPTSRG